MFLSVWISLYIAYGWVRNLMSSRLCCCLFSVTQQIQMGGERFYFLEEKEEDFVSLVWYKTLCLLCLLPQKVWATPSKSTRHPSANPTCEKQKDDQQDSLLQQIRNTLHPSPTFKRQMRAVELSSCSVNNSGRCATSFAKLNGASTQHLSSRWPA